MKRSIIAFLASLMILSCHSQDCSTLPQNSVPINKLLNLFRTVVSYLRMRQILQAAHGFHLQAIIVVMVRQVI